MCAWSVAGQVPAAVPITIEQAVSEAVAHNLNVLAERYNVDVAEAAVITAGLRPNPVVTASLMRPDQSLVDAGISPYEQVFRTDYVLERGGKLERRQDQAALSKSVVALQIENTIRTLRLDVQSAFTDLLLARRNLSLAQENLTAFDDVVRINTERVRTGDLSAVELSRSRLAALQFKNDVRQQETRLSVAKNRLSTLLGRGPNGDALEATGDLRKDAQPIEYEQLRQRALEARPDVRALRADQLRSAADARLQMANGTIDYTISGEYHRQEGSEVRGNSYGVFLSAPLPIFNRNQGEIARAQVQTKQALARVHALEQDIGAEAKNAFADYSASRDIVETIETQMLAPANDVRTTTEYSYRRGEASFVELLDAVRAYNDTMQSYNEARAAYARSLFTLDAIAGKVTP